jgi:hypothetical protein
MGLFTSLAFKKLPDNDLASFATDIYQKMSADAKYLPFKTFYDDIKVKNDAFILSISAASKGGADRTANKNDRRKDLLKPLVAVAHQLEDNANDVERFITDAGYEIRNTGRLPKTVVVITELATPNLTAKNLENRTGAVLLTWAAVQNAINYAIQYKPKAETVWKNGIFSDKLEYTFVNLQSEMVFDFQIYAIGPDGVKSDIATAIPVWVS